MLSDVLVDDDRFRQILDDGISKGTIESYPLYERENKDEKRQRAKEVEKKRREDYDKRQAKKQEAQPSNGATNGKAKGKSKKTGGDDMAGLAALIQQRQKSRAGNFFDSLEAKYAPKSRGSKRSTPMDEPSEEMFQANRGKKAKNNGRSKKAKDQEEDVEMGEEDIGDSEEEDVPSKSKTRAKAKAKGRGRATKA
jgi:DnaJ family protein C protein 9